MILPPGVRRPRLYLLDHHSAPSSVRTARSNALLAASSVRHAPRQRSAPVVVVAVRGLTAEEAQHAAERRSPRSACRASSSAAQGSTELASAGTCRAT